MLLRDPQVVRQGPAALDRLAEQVKDHNYRLFAEDGLLHLISAGIHLTDADPYAFCIGLLAPEPRNLDAAHAFYLGYEMAKATTALTLGKDYRQDEALDWGFLTVPERSHRDKKGTSLAAPTKNAATEANRAGSDALRDLP